MTDNAAWMYMVGVLGGLYKDDSFVTESIGHAIATQNGKVVGTIRHSMSFEPDTENEED